tara:strand:- start:570 stop:1073 length:504 start_codon:yes stop_codon:yes gene_type:complete
MTSRLLVDKIEGKTTASTVQMPEGSVVQMQNATLAGGANSSNATSFTDTGLTLNITPKFATSKILVLVHHAISINSSTNTRVDFRCIENGSSTEIYRLDYHGNDGNNVSNTQRNMSGSGVFQCSNTNQLTFKTQVQEAGPIASEAGSIFYDWYTGSIHTIQAMEVAQ